MKRNLTESVVHVWKLHIPDAEFAVERLRILLAEDERERAARFRFAHLERSFAIAHGILRMILETYTETPANRIQLQYGKKGKPSLPTSSRIQFNIAHSENLAVFAFALDCDIGIDIEKIRPMPDRHEIASQFFCAEETRELASLPINEQEHGFFLCWTRKEAYIKATGDGLSCPLNAFQVTLRPREIARFVNFRAHPDSITNWSLNNLELDPLYAAALAYRARERKIVTMDALKLLSIQFG